MSCPSNELDFRSRDFKNYGTQRSPGNVGCIIWNLLASPLVVELIVKFRFVHAGARYHTRKFYWYRRLEHTLRNGDGYRHR
jgi:hypothetical protein